MLSTTFPRHCSPGFEGLNQKLINFLPGKPEENIKETSGKHGGSGFQVSTTTGLPRAELRESLSGPVGY